TAGSMFEKLSAAGAELLMETLPKLADGSAPRMPQDDSLATYAPNLTREDERLLWERTSRELFDQARGLYPMAGAFTFLGGEVFKVWGCRAPVEADAKLGAEALAAAPGTVLEAGAGGIRVRTGDGSLVLTQVQPAGKKALPAA